jgi:hypothetical protein
VPLRANRRPHGTNPETSSVLRLEVQKRASGKLPPVVAYTEVTQM